MNQTTAKTRALEQFRAERAAFEAVLAQVSEAQIATAEVQEAWTIKDILAHISAWEVELLRWLAMAARGEAPDTPSPGNWETYMQAFNQRTYEANRERPLPDVLDDFQRIYQQLMGELEALPEDPNDKLWSAWYGGQPPWGLIATYPEHYSDHRQPIEAWLGSA